MGSSALLITVQDDIPIARNDGPLDTNEGSITTESTGTPAWNLLTSTSASWKDSSGADEPITITRVDYVDSADNPQFSILSGGTTGELDTKYGKLTVWSNGEWKYVSDPYVTHLGPGGTSVDPVSESITYTITDRDGDTATATKSINIYDTIASISDPLDTAVYERNLPTGSVPNPALLVTTGTLGIHRAADPIDVRFNGASPPSRITSNGSTIYYHESADGHTLTATDTQSNGNVIFTIVISDYNSSSAYYTFTLYRAVDHVSVDPYGVPTMLEFIDFPITYKIVETNEYPLDTVTNFPSGINGGGAANFIVRVYDDTGLASPALTLQEDEPLASARTITISADATSANLTITGTLPLHGTVEVNDGTIPGRPNGTITYTPYPNYSGTDTFEYTLINDGSDPANTTTRTVNVTVIPVSDRPGVTVDDSTLSTLEDTSVLFGLNLPTITDNGSGAGNNPLSERLGLITLSGIPDGATLLDGTAADVPLLLSTGLPITVYINDIPGYHLSTLVAADATLSLTTAQYEALKILPPSNSGLNFSPDITVSVTEYEVDPVTGAQISISGVPVPGVTTTATIAVEVLAVTDIPPAPGLQIGGFDTPYTATFDEDTVFNLGTLLTATAFDDTTDGSEYREVVLSGFPAGAVGSVVTYTTNGIPVSVTIHATSDTVTIPLINGGGGIQNVLPGITITPPSNFSGDMNGITVTLQALDTDPNLPAALPVPVLWSDSVTLNLHVSPVADDITAPDVSTPEDTPVQFMHDLKTTDLSTDPLNGGQEVITGITIKALPAGWKLYDETGVLLTTGSGVDYIVDPLDVTTPYSGDPTGNTFNYQYYTIQPPAHSSADLPALGLEVTSTDTSDPDGDPLTPLVVDTKTAIHSVKVTVTPVAEAVGGAAVHNGTDVTAGGDSDGNAHDDLTINPDHLYTAHGTEDVFYSLTEAPLPPDEPGFNIEGFWVNEDADGSEKTYALFTPKDSTGAGMIGAQFRYTDGTGTHTVTYGGTPIAIEMPYLHTVEFKPKTGYSGNVTIDVQAKTVDHGPDDTTTDVFNISGLAHLSFVFNPVANDVTLAVTSPVPVLEDYVVSLSIRPTTTDTDGSESFTITIEQIPVGAVMSYYDGMDSTQKIFTATAGNTTLTIGKFDSSKPLTIQPPHDSNEDFTLHVTGYTVEVLDPLHPGTVCQSLDILVDVKGVADPVDVVPVVAGFSEARLDAALSPYVTMDKVITVTLQDSDFGRIIKSETLSFYFTGLAEGFAISGPHVSFLGGTGTARRWLLTPGDFANTIMTIPQNFSGKVTFEGVPVTSENDGNSLTGSTIPLSLTVSPAPEATIVDHTVFNEDQWVLTDPLNPVMGVYARVNFDLQQQHGDTNETLDSVWIKADGVNGVAGQPFTLFYDPDGPGAGVATQTFAAAGFVADGGYYKLTTDQSKHIYVQNTHDLHGSYTFEVKYEITDPTSGGTTVPIINPLTGIPTGSSANAVTTQTTTTYTLTVNAVTDPITDPLGGAITAMDETVFSTVVAGNVVTVYGSTVLTVPVVVTQSDYLLENPGGQDLDGSEMLERFIIDGVPDGITVIGATYVGDTSTTANTGRWILDVNPDVSFISSIPQNISFDFDGTASQFIGWSKTISITAESRDAGSGIRSASVSFTIDNSLVTSFDDSGKALDTPALITPWIINPLVSAVEDTSSSLADLTTVAITGGGSSPFSITMKNVPAGTIVTGMERMVLPPTVAFPLGEVVYTASGTGGDAELQTLLHAITLTPPLDSNENNHNNQFVFDLALTTYAPGGLQNTETLSAQIEVLPVSDPTTTVITPRVGSEYEDDRRPDTTFDGVTGVLFTVSFQNVADGAFNQLTSYLTIVIDDTLMDSHSAILKDGSGTVITPFSDIGRVTTYHISGVSASNLLNYTYVPVVNASGSIAINASVNSSETGSVLIAGTPGSATIDVIPVIDGYQPTSIIATGPEDTRIPLVITGGGLIDLDGSETVQSILLKNVHNDYLVYIGANAGSAVLALNAGSDAFGHNTWSLGTVLPAYIAIEPPKNVSGTDVTGIALAVITAERGLPGQLLEQSFSFDLVVTPVPDVVTISPTHAFGTEGQKVPINLNASMADYDGSETATVTLQGLGRYASFYGAGGTELTLAQYNPAIHYDIGTDTYTLSGLTVADTNALSVIQSATNGSPTVHVTAYTVEGTAPPHSASVTGDFTLSMAAGIPTTGHDSLLYDSSPARTYDGGLGDDSLILRKGEDMTFDAGSITRIQNIEIIDLSISGINTVYSLEATDVLAVTDDRNTLYILGTGDDSVQLGGTLVSGSSGFETVNGNSYLMTKYSDSLAGATVYVQDGVHVI